ncbi:MAG: UxaA family hydrolase [Pseudorhodobacter sp.]
MTVSALRLHPTDNVACLLRDHGAGEVPVLAEGIAPALTGPIAMGHKIALVAIAMDEPVIKYGATIGHATQDIPPGAHVHLHNLVGAMR